MSCYEWERGTIRLPSRDYPRFRKEILTAWNNNELRLFEVASACFKELKAKSIKTSELENAVRKAIEARTRDLEYYRIFDLLVTRSPTGAIKLRAPRKSDLSIRKVSAGCAFSIEDAEVYFDDKTCTVTWAVSENNHARRHSRSHPIAQELFRKLDAITWVRGTGGTIVGNDEYSRDNDYEGGGGNYVTAHYGHGSGRRLHRY